MEILAVKNLNFAYPCCVGKAVEDVSFSVKKGEFIALCGATGSGKSTLLRLLKRELQPLGELSGEVLLGGKNVNRLSVRDSAGKIGFVMQRPEQQIVTDKVWHELAFGLENLGTPKNEMRRRIAEISEYFGISGWFEKGVDELSGGQKQLLNLAAVMVMQPELLILDEPTAQLDPIAASDFIATLQKLNRELGLTIIIAEHRLEDVIPICDRMMVMDKGRLRLCLPPREAAQRLNEYPELLKSMPASVRIYNALDKRDEECPLTIREGSDFICRNFGNSVKCLAHAPKAERGEAALEFENVWFRYGRNLPDVLKGTNFTACAGEIFCLLGGNGSGKSTLLKNASGIARAYSGSIKVFGKKIEKYKENSLYKECLAFLPQDVQAVFLKNTVREELAEVGGEERIPVELFAQLQQKNIFDSHPYDLSGGEQQLVAFAKVLAAKPRILLLDEPTKGLDARTKQELSSMLKKLKNNGVAVVVVTHDVEFAAETADRCAMFFRGEIISADSPEEFFACNNFYSTAANRMTRGHYEKAVTVEQAVELCRANGERSGR